MKRIFTLLLGLSLSSFALISCTPQEDGPKIYNVADYGLKANDSSINATEIVGKIIEEIRKADKPATIVFEKGQYHFSWAKAAERVYYISNHDQDNPKTVGIPLDEMEDLTVDGGGSEFLFTGRMIPISIVGCEDVIVKNFSVDFPQPQNGQATIIENDIKNKKITYQLEPWMDYEFDGDKLINKGEGWDNTLIGMIAFDGETGHVLYRTSDVWFATKDTEELGDRKVKVTWNNPKLTPGSKLALRSLRRPSPGVFISLSKNTVLEDVTVHYSEGMGLLAQMSEDITLQGFNVSLKEGSGRCFTSQADATHFSGCKGKIISKGGLYENMMDDAINVHGTYLKIEKRINDTTVEAAYKHKQAYGFFWGEAGDDVQFVTSNTMELTGGQNVVKSIKPVDKPTIEGAKVFQIEFEKPLDASVNEECGIENLTWTPEVLFADNTIRNNRARGTLFSTPKKTIVENNFFDHTSGTAILLCGDCNGWYETGACRDVVIRNNHFVNALTNMFQFTNGVISIYPEIPNLKEQKAYFHGGNKDAVLIENNTFEMFDKPIVYAKSIDGLTFRNNTIITNNDFEPFHEIKVPFYFERVINWSIEDNNKFDKGFDIKKDVIVKN
ncbi:MAG: alpha-1,3-galactosidase B [Rikenellaceae bacterium]